MVSALVCNLILTGATDGTFFKLAFEGQAVAHTDGLWNCLGMYLVGFGCVLLGGCPLRQLVLSGEGNTDSAVTVVGLIVGAAFAHNFGLAGSAASLTDDVYKVGGISNTSKIVVVCCIVLLLSIAAVKTFVKEKKAK